MIVEGSLSQTLNNINAAILLGEKPSAASRKKTALWIAARQGLAGSYAGTFALFNKELHSGIRVITGELMTSASARHIAGEEACRALAWLDSNSAPAKAALERANQNLQDRICSIQPRLGWFCCGKCSVSLWRNLTMGGLNDKKKRLADALNILKAHRTPDGRWQRFPFYYTLSSLIEMDRKLAKPEIMHAAKQAESMLKRNAGDDLAARCRHKVLEKVLEI